MRALTCRKMSAGDNLRHRSTPVLIQIQTLSRSDADISLRGLFSQDGMHVAFRTVMQARTQRGVTLLELMVVVIIIAILAAVAIPMLSQSTRRARASEVATMFSKFKMRQEQYQVENGVFLSTGTSDSDYFPAAPAGPDRAQAYGAVPDSWRQLKINPDYDKLWCAYVSVAGERGDGSNIGTVASTTFGYSQPPRDGDWFYMVAECDFDDDPGVNALYFMSSDMAEIADFNQGS